MATNPNEHPDWYDNWSDELKALSFPTTIVSLTDPIRQAIYEIISNEGQIEEGKQSGINSAMSDLGGLIFQALLKYPDGAFLKLSSRSPKDSWLGHKKGFKVRGGAVSDAIRRLLDSERIMEDIQLPGVNLLVREWKDMRQEDEWRCFQYGGEFVGMSQYFYRDCFKYSEYELQSALHIARIAHAAIEPHVPENIIFDLYLPPNIAVALEEPAFTLIEINPWITHPFGTDPCLCNWDELIASEKPTLKYNAMHVAMIDND